MKKSEIKPDNLRKDSSFDDFLYEENIKDQCTQEAIKRVSDWRMKQKIKCNAIEYRKGFIEVKSNIHAGCINLETWSIHPDVDISDDKSSLDTLSENDITGNTEIELTVERAKELVRLLQLAIDDSSNQEEERKLANRAAENFAGELERNPQRDEAYEFVKGGVPKK